MANCGSNRGSSEVIVFETRPFRITVVRWLCAFHSTFGAIECTAIMRENKKPGASAVESEEQPQMEFDMQKARYDVLRFGMTGFDKEKQKKDKISMAIKLGAKPPKKEYKNYKELMAEKKVQKEEDVADKFLKQYCLEILKQKKRAQPHKKMKKKN